MKWKYLSLFFIGMAVGCLVSSWFQPDPLRHIAEAAVWTLAAFYFEVK